MANKSNWRTILLGQEEYEERLYRPREVDQRPVQSSIVTGPRPIVRTEAEVETAKQIADVLMMMNGIEVMGERIAQANPQDPDGLSLMQQARRGWVEGKIQFLNRWAAAGNGKRY